MEFEQNIHQILIDLGYQLTPDSKGWRSKAIYREGDNPTSLLIYKDGGFSDFVEGKMGNFLDLVQLSTGLKTIEETKDWLKTKSYNVDFSELNQTNRNEKLNQPVYFSESEILNLEQDHSYWIKRGISESILKEFRGGVCKEGKLKNRYVFPIFNKDNKIIGFQGRTLINSKIKYKFVGQRGGMILPNNNDDIIQKEQKVIIVEGIGCILSLYEAGIRNCKCNFGTDMSLGLLNHLLRISPQKIIISLNFDEHLVGQEASEKLQRRLWKYFDRKQIIIKYPPAKDFNVLLEKTQDKEMSLQKIKEWYNSI